MLGFFIGTICLLGFIKLAWCGRHHRWAYAGGSCGYRGGGGPRGCGDGPRGHGGGPRRGFRYGFGERAILRWVFERLDTTHGQEKVIFEAVEEIKAPLKEAKGDWRAMFGDLAKAMRAGEFDHNAVAGTWVRQDKAIEQARLAITTALARIHDVLDEGQRKILADLIESGPRFGGFRNDEEV